MKHVIFGLLAGFVVCADVMAADVGTAIPDGVAIDTTVAAGCSLLSEDVTINMSNSVFGAYACNVEDNVIGIATCHPTGRKGNVTVACDPTAVSGGVGFVAGCTVTDAQAPTVGTGTVQGGLAFTASSQGGRVSGAAAANCVAGGDTIAEAQDAAGL
ncbi:hypothetical protein [Pseudomonas sp.]|uniref:hypothetical protein n=1 Tax=Pseudomonas sp. TaxID=306 RepID=UPI00299E1FF4|nr:hypothetical protein [Pseudomonas sp.]MDX1369594.1 hypothetical protein [Pseudomonas sp.]